MASIPWATLIDEPYHRAFQCPDTGAVELQVICDGHFHDALQFTFWHCKVRADRIDGRKQHIREVAKKLFDLSEKQIQVINPCEIEKRLFDYVKELTRRVGCHTGRQFPEQLKGESYV